jgi:hypothetical protein
MMADRKEVLDYLRNQQKAAEIESKVNGVNVWVLLGAIAVVGWQLISAPSAKLWSDYELTARILVASVALHMLSRLISKSGSDSAELRYSQSNFFEVDSPSLILLRSVLIFLPPFSLWLLAGKSVGAIVLSLFGLLMIIFSLISILKPLLPESQKSEKFPKPEFGLTKRADLVGDLLFTTLLLVAFIEQIAHIRGMQGGISIADAKAIVLLAVLYLLVLITVTRKQQNDSIAWTYELETEIVLGAISPEVAIRKIENRRLGPRLQDVVDRFFDDLDQRFAELDLKLTECTEKINAAKKVPEEYSAERAARITAASEGTANQINSLVADCKEFGEYLAKLDKKLGGGRKAVLGSLKTRHYLYNERARTAKLQLERLRT